MSFEWGELTRGRENDHEPDASLAYLQDVDFPNVISIAYAMNSNTISTILTGLIDILSPLNDEKEKVR